MLAHREVHVALTVRNVHATMTLPKFTVVARLRARFDLSLDGLDWFGFPYDLVKATCTMPRVAPGEEVTRELTFVAPSNVRSFSSGWCDALVQLQVKLSPHFSCVYAWRDFK